MDCKSLVIEGVLPHHGDDGVDDLLVGERAVLRLVIGDALGGVVVVLAAQAHDDVGDGLAEQVIFGLVALFQRLQLREPSVSSRVALPRRRSALR